MSYNIGQLRRNQINNYYEEEIPLTYSTSITYKIGVLQHNNRTGFINLQLKKNKSYHLIFKVASSNPNPFKLKLRGNDKEMIIKEFRNPGKDAVYEVVFTPNDEIYTVIVAEPDQGKTSVSLNSAECVLKPLVNVISVLSTKYDGLRKLEKMGIQGPTGLLFSMNGEEIRIGKSGIYEVQDFPIENLGFVIKDTSPVPYQDGKDFFIMDFQY